MNVSVEIVGYSHYEEYNKWEPDYVSVLSGADYKKHKFHLE